MSDWSIDFSRFFEAAPPEIDRAAIWDEGLSLSPNYAIEERQLALPVWARRGLPDSGKQAWEILSEDLEQFDPSKPYCIYIHTPFCSSKCSFCDCYSFRLGAHREQHIDRYSALLVEEMQNWSKLGTLARRPVSTVHFGGGTPSYLGPAAFEMIVQGCRANFTMQPDTEWALESTTSDLTEEMLNTLGRLGFTRLHLGIQSLDPLVRAKIGRRETPRNVLDKIAVTVASGWVISVDLIYGLPAQSLESLLNDIRTLADLGVDGFSLYELQTSRQNRSFIDRHHITTADRLQNYLLFQAAVQHLKQLGYRKTLYNHFARERDTNLYFTFPERDEDCLALGTIADGVFGDYHYRHQDYSGYCQARNRQSIGLQGGLRRLEVENRLRLLEIALFSSRLNPRLFASVLGETISERTFARWSQAALIRRVDGEPLYHLTTSGSWFLGTMLHELYGTGKYPF